MNTQTKVTGVLATLLVFGAAPIPSYAVTAEHNASFQPAVQHGADTSDLLVLAAARGGGGRGGGGGGARGGGGAARGGGGGGAAAANRGAAGGGAAAANRGGGQRQVRSQATSNVNHRASNANVNNNRAGNANINNNRNNVANNSGNRNINNVNNVNVAGDFDGGGWNGGWDDDYHPFAAAAVVGGTAAIVGSMVNSIPPSCTPVVSNGVTYSQCGSTYYQPQYAGTSVQYEVVAPPQ